MVSGFVEQEATPKSLGSSGHSWNRVSLSCCGFFRFFSLGGWETFEGLYLVSFEGTFDMFQ